ncbi:hypothetical protein CAL26_16050 [Bordetella genomosp. 9]|uniref:Uncharacterized protein n=1 Tax=Bordetella genomosp. 9 TaxID=1416803 RepID=A0A261R290_9BORD|nr:hypothetical protein [Bordetella genomosp. 9]OZI19165.1 hypothetical protein CAL26_16050 [Bordetella genomosp. 9]
MSMSTTLAFGAAAIPAPPDPLLPARHAFEATHASAAFDAVPVEPSAPQARFRRDGPASDRSAGPTQCYYTMNPLNDVRPDADGKIRGADLQGTLAYERLVHTLSKDPLAPARDPSDADKAKARVVVDRMRLPLRGTLVAPCHTGHGPGDRSVHEAATPSPAAAGRQRRAVSEGADAHTDTGGNANANAPTPGTADPCRPAGLWQRVFDTMVRLVRVLAHPPVIPEAASSADAKRPAACREAERAADQRAAEQEARDYENHLFAWTASATRRRREVAPEVVSELARQLA